MIIELTLQKQNTVPQSSLVGSADCTQELEDTNFLKISCAQQITTKKIMKKLTIWTTSELKFVGKTSKISNINANFDKIQSSLLYDFSLQIIPSVERIAQSQVSTLLAKIDTLSGIHISTCFFRIILFFYKTCNFSFRNQHGRYLRRFKNCSRKNHQF